METHLALRISTATNRKKDAGEQEMLEVRRFLMDRVAGMEPQLRMVEQKVEQKLVLSTHSLKLKP
jgi:hypothetical protein